MQVRRKVVIPYNSVSTWPQALQNELRMTIALFTGLGLKHHTSPEYLQSLTDVLRSITEDEKVRRGVEACQSAVRAWAEAKQAVRVSQ